MAEPYYRPNPFDLFEFVKSIERLDYGAMIVATDERKRQVEASSYGVAGAPARRRAGSERFIDQLKNLGWYLRSDGLRKPPFAERGELYAYRPITEKLVASGDWSAEGLKILPARVVR